MFGKTVVASILLLLPLFSLTKSASYADRRLEEFHDALIRKEEQIHEISNQGS